eukprot:TRINITY_DN354_c0_g1_i1.p1 TRINITY_DN354_c0_g1~~TRINITY_DN354_c0_g1_i1.p1  ORF type:complete len:300 (-),score=57.06 TRINITY_DN354_c0_g1_i1:72-971(-)
MSGRRRPSEDDDYAEAGLEKPQRNQKSRTARKSTGGAPAVGDMEIEMELVDEEMQDCQKLLHELMSHPIAYPFNEPVDWQMLGLFTYPQVVKKPMDLLTIREMLKHNLLENPEHFAIHVRLVFQNAQTFNLEGSDIYNSATTLLEHFNQLYSELCQRWRQQAEQGTMNDGSIAGGPSAEEKEEIDALSQSVEELKQQVADLKQSINELKKNQKQLPNIKRVKLSRPKAPLSFKQKEEICKKMSELEEDHLPGLLKIIRPGGAAANEVLEINLEELDDPTLLNIQKYINRCKKQTNTKKK